jgi:hypothetical protein
MKLRYFVVDGQGRLRKTPHAAVRALWDGGLGATALGCPAGSELRLVSVVCDDELLPQKVYLLRLPMTRGTFTFESRMTLHLFSQPDCVTPGELSRHHAEGWPSDFFRQLAVALDVSVASVSVPLGIGGPLLLAAALGVSPREALRHLCREMRKGEAPAEPCDRLVDERGEAKPACLPARQEPRPPLH